LTSIHRVAPMLDFGQASLRGIVYS
jgi:hypothetical protein